MKIVTIVGARPNFIKAAAVSRIFAKYAEVKEVIVHTGQHFDENMSNVFFEEMDIPYPDYNLNVNGLSHGAMTGQMLEGIESVLMKEKPDWVLVYGDTNSTLAGALAAKKMHIKLAHVEGGLRSNNLDNPEEMNRVIIDRISDIIFCPSDSSMENLRKEGIDIWGGKMVMSGDVMCDAARYYMNSSRMPEQHIPEKFVLATIHRAENTDDVKKLNHIFKALERISEECPVVIPIHPRTKMKLDAAGYNFSESKVCFIPPVGYLEMMYLLKSCEYVICDSGGLQKEAYFSHKYCVFVHEIESVWIELQENGFLFQANADYNSIMDCVRKVADNPGSDFNKQLYGEGKASEVICEEMIKYRSVEL